MDRDQISKPKTASRALCSFFRIADFSLKVCYTAGDTCLYLLPSMDNFKGNATDDLLFTLTIDKTTKPTAKYRTRRIKVFDTGNGDIIVDEINGGGYQFVIKDTSGRVCCLLKAGKDFSSYRCALNGNSVMKSYGLNNAFMLAFAFSSSFHQTLLMHASVVRHKGFAYAFTAKSGTGKSTHTALWLRNIDHCDLMNDDNPIIRIIHGAAWLYGSPWSGKTPCYRDIKAPLGAITVIDRAPENSIDRLSPIEAFVKILPSCSSMKWDKRIYGNTCNNIIKLIECCNNNYILHCRPDDEAAIVCHNAIAHDTSKDS